ncbi:16S rRNA (guanine(966)-N(2))-methyltransferase RsmD [Fervidobacterium sp.]
MLKIETGDLRGKTIDVVPDPRTRYTAAIIRRSLANMVDFEGKTCLDICAGSGIVGIEMLSNGAQHVTFVDVSGLSISTIKRNIKKLGLEEKVDIKRIDARRFLESNTGVFDIIYSDPPYELGLVDEITLRVHNVMREGSLFILQCSKREKPRESTIEKLRIVKEKDYGDTLLIFFEKA